MAEEELPLEVELKATEGTAQRQLNTSAAATISVSIIFLLLAMNMGRSTRRRSRAVCRAVHSARRPHMARARGAAAAQRSRAL